MKGEAESTPLGYVGGELGKVGTILRNGTVKARARVLQVLRILRLERFDRDRLRCQEAADLLGTYRGCRRLYEVEVAEGCTTGGRAKASWRCAPIAEATKLLEWFAARRLDFTVEHFHEKPEAQHGIAPWRGTASNQS
jgi:hypothetical protein